MQTTHLLCYIRRDSLTSWKLDSLERGTQNNPVLAYGSNDPTFARFAKRGNVLWIVGAYSEGLLSLEAKLEISGPLHKDKEWKCEVKGSRSGSAFFGLNDASNTVMQLVFKSESSVWSLRDKYSTARWKNIYGQELQSPRRLATVGDRVKSYSSIGAALLEELEEMARNRSVFISWKHCDNNRSRRQFVRALTTELVKRQFSVWWDKVALTDIDALNDYSKRKKDNLMHRLLRQGLAQSTAILGLWTERYGTPSYVNAPNWTRDEWNVRHDVFRFAVSPGDFEPKPHLAEPDQVLRIPRNPQPADAVSLARRFKKAYDSVTGCCRR